MKLPQKAIDIYVALFGKVEDYESLKMKTVGVGEFFEVDHLLEKRFEADMNFFGALTERDDYPSIVVPKNQAVKSALTDMKLGVYDHLSKTKALKRLIPHGAEGFYTPQEIWDAHVKVLQDMGFPKQGIANLENIFKDVRPRIIFRYQFPADHFSKDKWQKIIAKRTRSPKAKAEAARRKAAREAIRAKEAEEKKAARIKAAEERKAAAVKAAEERKATAAKAAEEKKAARIKATEKRKAAANAKPKPTVEPTPTGSKAEGELAKVEVERMASGQPSAVAERELGKEVGDRAIGQTVRKELGQVAAKDIAARRSLISRIRFHPKFKFVGGLLVDALLILADIFFEWRKQKKYEKILKLLDEKVKVQINTLNNTDATISEFTKFRRGEHFEEGYQLFYRVVFDLVRYGDYHIEGGPITYYGEEAKLLLVALVRKKGSDMIPEFESDGGDLGDDFLSHGSGQFYYPIFESGVNITPAAEDAADEKFQKISQLRNPSPSTMVYLSNFKQYVNLFPNSAAAKQWNDLTNQFYFEVLLVATGIFKYQDLMFFAEYPFPYIMNNVNFLPGVDLDFIQSYQRYLDKLQDPERKSILAYESKKYFDRLRKERVCDYYCHTPVATAVPVKLLQFEAPPVKVVPPVVQKKPVFVDKGDKMLTDSCHKPGDRGVTVPMTDIIKKTSFD